MRTSTPGVHPRTHLQIYSTVHQFLYFARNMANNIRVNIKILTLIMLMKVVNANLAAAEPLLPQRLRYHGRAHLRFQPTVQPFCHLASNVFTNMLMMALITLMKVAKFNLAAAEPPTSARGFLHQRLLLHFLLHLR